jgi:hypothetical protein
MTARYVLRTTAKPASKENPAFLARVGRAGRWLRADQTAEARK